MISPVDAGLLLALGLTTLVGVLRGAVKEGLTLLLWAVAMLLAVGLAQELSRWLPAAIGEGLLRDRFAFFLAFALALALGTLAQRVLFLGALDVDLGIFGHLLGGAFGALRGGLFLLVLAGVLEPLFGVDSWWGAGRLSDPLGEGFFLLTRTLEGLLVMLGWR